MPNRKILLVDDDPEMRLALGVRLKHNGFDVFSAVDGVSAVSEARKHMPDLILLDLGLPAGDGFTVIDRLGKIDVLASTPIIVISGRDKLASRDRAITAGARMFLQKPVTNVELLAAIRLTLDPRSSPLPEAGPIIYDLSGPAGATVA